MKKASAEDTLKKKIEVAFYNLIEANSTGISPICGHELLGEPPEKCILIWAQNVGPFEDMPPSTGVKSVTLLVRVEVPESQRDVLLDKVVSDIHATMSNVPHIQQVVNLNGRNPDKRPVKLLHVYDLELSTNPDMKSEEYSIEELSYSVTCGEHDG